MAGIARSIGLLNTGGRALIDVAVSALVMFEHKEEKL